MIYSTIGGRVASGKLNEASAFLQKYADGIKKLTGHDVNILGEVGETHSVMSTVQYESLAEMEAVIDSCWGSEEYMKLMDVAEGLFVDGVVHVWKSTS